MSRLWAWLLAKLQERCRHDGPEQVTADILEGDVFPRRVRWCRVCGAFQLYLKDLPASPDWATPKPLWWVR